MSSELKHQPTGPIQQSALVNQTRRDRPTLLYTNVSLSGRNFSSAIYRKPVKFTVSGTDLETEIDPYFGIKFKKIES